MYDNYFISRNLQPIDVFLGYLQSRRSVGLSLKTCSGMLPPHNITTENISKQMMSQYSEKDFYIP